jgi:hypothetical protein
MKRYFRLKLDLFDEGGAGASSAAPAAEGAGTESTTSEPGRESKTVFYGKGAGQSAELGAAGSEGGEGQAEGEKTNEAPEALDKEFDKLIKGKYKDAFSRRMQSTIDRRFAESKNLEQKYSEQSKLINVLAARYNVSSDDPEALLSAFENDESYWADAAAKEGMTVEQYQHLKKLEAENNSYKANMLEAERQRHASEQVAMWQSQAEECKSMFPDFDLQDEMRNPAFRRLLQANVDVVSAYKATHFDEILQGGMRKAVQKTVGNVVNTIQTRQQRPAESALGVQSGSVEFKPDPSKWTDEDMEDVINRVKNGEKIYL